MGDNTEATGLLVVKLKSHFESCMFAIILDQPFGGVVRIE